MITTVLLVVLTYLIMKISELLTGMSAEIYSQLYTVVATLIAFLTPYGYEILKKYLNIRFEIREKRSNESDKI